MPSEMKGESSMTAVSLICNLKSRTFIAAESKMVVMKEGGGNDVVDVGQRYACSYK